MKLYLRRLIGLLWGNYCPRDGSKLEYKGYYSEKSWCRECYNNECLRTNKGWQVKV